MTSDPDSPQAASGGPAARLDRLSALLHRFRVRAEASLVPGPETNLFLLAPERDAAGATRPDEIGACALVYRPRGGGSIAPGRRVAVSARVHLGGADSALALALPDEVVVALGEAPALAALAPLLVEETQAPRCGGAAIIDRLCEVLVVRLLRHAIESGATASGLLAGLADRRIATALVAMHEDPQRGWRLDDLALRAGMSRSAFAARFHEVVGETPVAYLQAWRLGVAIAELDRGVPVKSVATAVGFASTAAFSRAFSRRYGHPPRTLRRA